MVVYDKDFIDSFSLFWLIICSGSCHDTVTGSRAADQVQFKSAVGVILASWPILKTTGHVLTQVLLIKHFDDLATRQLSKTHLVRLSTTYNHFFFVCVLY